MADSADSRQRTALPLLFGVGALLTALIGLGWLPVVAGFAGAFAAGWINTEEPVRAGLLTIAVPVLAALVRVLVEEPSAVGVLLFAAACAAVFALIASHLGAGMARRRSLDRPTR